VVWLGLSDDGHSVEGGFVFHVGLPGGSIAAAAEELLGGEAPASVSIPFAVVRFLNLALVLLCVGGTAALALVLYDTDERVQRSVRGKLVLAAGTLTLVAIAGIILQGAVVTRVGLADALDWSTASSVLETRFGKVWAVRAGLAAALGAVAVALSITSRRRGLLTDLMFGLAVFLSLTPSSSGHASVRGPVPYLADVAHVQAASAWAGGLAFIGLAVASSQARWSLAARVLPRFSALALAAVVILGVAAAVSAYHQVGSLAALRETDYGRLVLLKTGLATPLLLLGYLNWRHVRGIHPGVESPKERRRFAGIVVAELALVACIVAATALLVDEPPPSTAVAEMVVT
jgi:copper transport protein